MPVVMMVPAAKCLRAFGRVLVSEAVGPLAKRRLDEALGLAVGLRPVWSGEAMAHAEFLAGPGEVLRSERRAVVGEQPPYRHAQTRVVRHRVTQELHGRGGSLIGMHGGEGDAGVVVDRHEQHLPAGTIDRVAPVASDAVAGPLDAPELLGVDVQHVAWRLVLVANDGLGGQEIAQQGQAGTA